MRCIIIEDEPLAAERLKQFIAKLPDLQLEAAFDNAVDALVFLRNHQPDILFVDINLGEMSGIQLLEVLKPECAVIITTAYQEFALKGYELNVSDYLMKPFTFDRFFQAIEKVKQQQYKTVSAEKSFLFIKTEYRLEKVMLDDILYIEGMRDYRRIHLSDRSIMTLQTFREFETTLPQHIICRIHKSYMVSVAKISSIEKDRVRIADKRLPLSDTYKKAFLEIIGA